MNRAVIHYDEIALKGGHRSFFERHLIDNVRHALRPWVSPKCRRLSGRILLSGLPDAHFPAIMDRLAEVPGIAWFSRVEMLAPTVDALHAIAAASAELPAPAAFRVRARRANKRFPLDSQEIGRLVGARIQERTGWRVDLERADLTIHIDVMTEGILTYRDRRAGLGGLPVGASGTVLCLLSGGIDSPVAAFKMMCRGCRVAFVHFHNFGPDSPAVRRKIVGLVERLARFQPLSRLHLVPFARVQADLIAGVPPKMRMVAYRRAMLRLATRIAETEKARAIVVGDSVGQVASQTLENLGAAYAATPLPVLAPLIGDGKQAITRTARQIGTFETSILAYDDCCQRLVARSPETKCTVPQIGACEDRLPLDRHYDALEQTEVIEVPPWDAPAGSAP
jgi:thiamine biosynthesis protein ThiI